MKMKKPGSATDRAKYNGDLDDDADFVREEFLDDELYDEYLFDVVTPMDRPASRRRVDARRAGLQARRAIERIKEQMALKNELDDYDDYLN